MTVFSSGVSWQAESVRSHKLVPLNCFLSLTEYTFSEESADTVKMVFPSAETHIEVMILQCKGIVRHVLSVQFEGEVKL